MPDVCIGIPSWLPEDEEARSLRIDRLNRLVKQIKDFFDLPIIFVGQNWKDYRPDYGNYRVETRGKLGILNARKLLFKLFLESHYTHIILFDDDAIIEGTKELCSQYIEEISNYNKVFAFVHTKTPSCKYTPYCDSQLNLCCISKEMYKECPLPDIDPQNNEAFEDRVWSTLLHIVYSKYERNVPEGLRCIHFKNMEEKAPSTWSDDGHNWRRLRLRTAQLEHYIYLHHHLPKELKEF